MPFDADNVVSNGGDSELLLLQGRFERIAEQAEAVASELESAAIPAELDDFIAALEALRADFFAIARTLGDLRSRSLSELIECANRKTRITDAERFVECLRANGSDGNSALEAVRTTIKDCGISEDVLSALAALRELIRDCDQLPMSRLEELFQRVATRFSLGVALAVQSRRLVAGEGTSEAHERGGDRARQSVGQESAQGNPDGRIAPAPPDNVGAVHELGRVQNIASSVDQMTGDVSDAAPVDEPSVEVTRLATYSDSSDASKDESPAAPSNVALQAFPEQFTAVRSLLDRRFGDESRKREPAEEPVLDPERHVPPHWMPALQPLGPVDVKACEAKPMTVEAATDGSLDDAVVVDTVRTTSSPGRLDHVNGMLPDAPSQSEKVASSAASRSQDGPSGADQRGFAEDASHGAAGRPRGVSALPEASDAIQHPLSRLGTVQTAAELATAHPVDDQLSRALELLPVFPAAAYQLSVATAKLAHSTRLPLPAWIFRLFALSPLSATGAVFPNEQLRCDFQEAYAALSDESEYDTRALTALLAACAIGPAIVAPETTASTLLRALPLPGPLSELAHVVATLADQLGGVDLFALAPHASIDAWKAQRESLRRRGRAWLDDTDRRATSGLRFVPARNVLRSWLRNDGFLAAHMVGLAGASDVPQRLDDLIDIARTSRADINRLIDAADSGGSPSGNWIDGKARRVLVDTAETAIELLREWLSLSRSQPTTASSSRRQVSKILPDLDAAFERCTPLLDELVAHADARSAAAYRLLNFALSDLHARLHGHKRDASSRVFAVPPTSTEEALGRDLLLVPLTLDVSWVPVESPEEVSRVLHAFPTYALSDTQRTVEEHLSRRDFLDAERLLRRLPEDEGWASDSLAGLGRLVEESRKPYLARVEILKRTVELAFRDNLLSESERETFQNQMAWLGEAFAPQNFRSSVSRLTSIEDELTRRREAEADRLLRELLALREIDEASRERTKAAITNGQFLVAGEYLRQLAEGRALPQENVGQETDNFAEFFPSGLQALGGYFKGSQNPSDRVRRWVQDFEQTGTLGPLATQDRASELNPILNAWFTRMGKPSLVEGNVDRLFRWLGFEDVVVDRDERASTESRRIFDVKTAPIGHREIIPLPAFGSDRNGRYTVICHVNASTLHTESAPYPAIHFVQAPLDERRRRELGMHARQKGLQFVVLDDFLLLHLTTVSSGRLQAFFECALPFTGLQPYTGTASIVPPEMFYGREKEIAKVVDPNGTCLIYGGRQLGKTALLLQVVARHHNPADGRGVFWIDLKNHLQSDANAMFGRIFAALKAMNVFPAGRRGFGDSSSDDILAWLEKDDRRQLIFLLDEADDFLTMEQESGFKNVGALKSLMERSRKRFKIVFAGLHNVVRFSKIPNHPLAHFGEPVNIGPLMGAEWREALALIEKPMRALGYRFEEDAALSILLQANYYPVLLQLWGRHLLDHLYSRNSGRMLAGPPYRLDRDVVDATYSSRKELREQLREKFRFTLQLDERYMVIAYALRYIADEAASGAPDGVSFGELLETVIDVWPEGFRDMPHLDFRTYLDEMEGLGVLRPLPDDKYGFQNPTVPLLMGTSEEVIAVLLQPRQLAAYDPNQLRKFVNRSASPLTSIQLKELYGRTSGAVIIVGSDALGLDRLVEFLQQEESTCTIVADECADRSQFVKLNQRTVPSDDKTTFIVAGLSTPWNSTWVEYAIERGKKNGNGRRRRWLFLVSPRMAWQMDSDIERLERRGASIVRLERWKEAALTSWLNINGISLPHEKLEALSKLTGNQPWLLDRFKERIRRDGTAVQALESFAAACMAKEYAESYGRAIGLCDIPPKAAEFLSRLAEYGDPCTVDDLLELSETETIVDRERERREAADTMRWARRMSLATAPGEERWQARPDISFALH
jgi:hypothetical protein